MIDKDHFILYCPNCFWTPGINLATKNECPNCKIGFTLATETRERNRALFIMLAISLTGICLALLCL